MDSAETKLQSLVENADTELQDFLDMGKAVGANLDYSINSILDVEKILLQTKATEEKDPDLFFDAWLYTGRVVEKTKNGKWKISDEEDESYGLPVIAYPNVYKEEFCPILAVSSFLESRNFGDLYKIIPK